MHISIYVHMYLIVFSLATNDFFVYRLLVVMFVAMCVKEEKTEREREREMLNVTILFLSENPCVLLCLLLFIN